MIEEFILVFECQHEDCPGVGRRDWTVSANREWAKPPWCDEGWDTCDEHKMVVIADLDVERLVLAELDRVGLAE